LRFGGYRLLSTPAVGVGVWALALLAFCGTRALVISRSPLYMVNVRVFFELFCLEFLDYPVNVLAGTVNDFSYFRGRFVVVKK